MVELINKEGKKFTYSFDQLSLQQIEGARAVFHLRQQMREKFKDINSTLFKQSGYVNTYNEAISWLINEVTPEGVTILWDENWSPVPGERFLRAGGSHLYGKPTEIERDFFSHTGELSDESLSLAPLLIEMIGQQFASNPRPQNENENAENESNDSSTGSMKIDDSSNPESAESE